MALSASVSLVVAAVLEGARLRGKELREAEEKALRPLGYLRTEQTPAGPVRHLVIGGLVSKVLPDGTVCAFAVRPDESAWWTCVDARGRTAQVPYEDLPD